MYGCNKCIFVLFGTLNPITIVRIKGKSITYFCTILEDDNISNSGCKVVNAEKVAGRNKYLGFTV